MNKPIFNYVVLDVESQPDPSLLEAFMEKRKEKAKEALNKSLDKALEYKKEETQDKYKTEAYAKYEKDIDPAQFRKAMATDTDYNDVVLVGLKALGEEPLFMDLKQFADFLEELRKEGRYLTFITFNGKKFDFMSLVKSGLKKRLDLPYSDFKEMMKRFSNNSNNFKHIDLAEELGQTTGEFKSLDEYARIYLGKKKEFGGEDFFANATREDLEKKCREDLETTESLYNVFIPFV